ncbi:MAG: purine-binding chemotaxis protein CheW [Planctomycetes bacterium]|nr:purine-binding chemotaxis protein CheW [Planctomycetota bacterium]
MTTAIQSPASSQKGFIAGKYLSFQLSKEEYGIAILKVREIIGMVDVTPLPRTPEFVRGVINLRGRIIPVIDLRRKFGMAPSEVTNETCVVVVDVGRDADSAFRVGCIVDTVSEVLSIGAEHFEATPRCANTDGDYIAGLAKLKDRVLILLDIEKVIGDIDPATLAGAN